MKGLTLCAALLVAVSAVALGGEAGGGVAVSYRLPADGPLPRTWRVTLAVVDARNTNWVIREFVAGRPRTVTAENGGRFTDTWDGLDDNFMPVPPGTYKVKGIYMPAEKWPLDDQYHTLVAKLHSGPFCWLPRPDQDRLPPKVHGDPVGSPPGDLDTGPNGRGVFYWIYLENGTNNFLFDLTRPPGLETVITGYPSGGAAGGRWTCTDGETVWSYCADGGIPFVYRPDGTPFGKGRARYRDKVHLPEGAVCGLAAWRDPAAGRTFVYVAEGGRIVLAQQGRGWQEDAKDRLDRVRVLDGRNGAVLGAIPAAQVRAITARNGRLYALQQEADGFVVRSVALEGGLPAPQWDAPIRLQGVSAPSDLDVDSRGRLYIADPKANHVYRLGPDGTVAARLGRTDGQVPGRYDPLTMMAPSRVAAWRDAEGNDRIIVMESEGPARYAEWSPDGDLLRQWQTPQPNGNNGWAVDPADPTRVYIMGIAYWLLRFKVDYEAHTWTVDAVWPGVTAGMKTGWAPHGIGYPNVAHVNGRTYITFARGYAVYRLDGERLVPSAGVLKTGATAWQVWNDANGNGAVDEDETRPLARPPGVFGYWGDSWQPDLSLVAVGQGTRSLWRLAPDGFDVHGNPVYREFRKLLDDPVLTAKAEGRADAVHGGNEVYDVFNSSWRSVLWTPETGFFTDIRGGGFSANHAVEQKITRYVPDGDGYRPLWRIGRCANIQSEPGAIIGSIFMGAPAHGLVGVIDQTRAGCHVFTADEGLYVDTLLLDGSKARETIYGQGGEFFAGSTFLNRRDGKVYLAWGKLTPILFEVQGWKADAGIRPVEGLPESVSISAIQTASPPARAVEVRGGAGLARIVRFTPAAGGPPALDGTMKGWEACEPVVAGSGERTFEVRCMYRPDHLYLRWHVRTDARVPIRPLQPAERLFTHDRGADTLSFYLQGDPAAQGAPVGGRPGDVRFVFGLFDDGGRTVPAVLGLYPKWFGKEPARPYTYGSPVGKVTFEHVGLVPEIAVGYAMDKDAKGFVLTADIPRAALPPTLGALDGSLRTTANFEVTFGGSDKLWWSLGDGSASSETVDEPSEARLYPGSWAQARFDPILRLPIRTWQVIGPFGFEGMAGFDHRLQRNDVCRILSKAVYPPEKGVDLSATYTGEIAQTRQARRTLKWRRADVPGDRVEFADALGWKGYEDEGTVYMATWIHAPRACEVKLDTVQGHGHYAVRGWLDGRPLPGVGPGGPSEKLDDRIDKNKAVPLRPGWNMLLVRWDHIWGDNWLGVRIDAPPEVLWDLGFSATPPKEQDRKD